MDEKKPVPAAEGAPAPVEKTAKTTPQITPTAYAVDGKERILLALAWGLGVLFVELFQVWFWAWGLVVPALVAAWYAVLLWYRGWEGFRSRESLALFAAVCLLSLTFPLYTNRLLRMWNGCALPALVAVQLYAWTGAAWPWTSPVMLLERFSRLIKGLFSWGPLARTITSFRASAHRRSLYVLGGAAAAIPLLLLCAGLLVSGDALFRYVSSGALDWLRLHVAEWAVKALIGLFLLPFLFGLLYALRRGKAPARRAWKGIALDPAAPVTVLLAMDALYLFYLAVQSAALFGGEKYLARTGMSYAEYARSGFFQLVFVAVINLTLILVCMQISRPSGRTWRWVQILSAVLVGESVVLLISAAWRMTLYVVEYGLTVKRFLTYWGMAMLAIFFVAALWKIFRKNFSFFKVLFAASLTGWLVLNFCNVDYLVARYNVDRYWDNRGGVVDLYYLTNLSYDALGPLSELPDEAPVGSNGTLREALAGRRADAAREAGLWRTWSVSAQLAAGEIKSEKSDPQAGSAGSGVAIS